jgi:PAS domain S-box-containing protein
MDDANNKEIRRKAKQVLEEKGSHNNSFDGDKDKLIEELNIHQIELEMQNKELLDAQDRIIEEQNRYKDLFMNAPVAYFILNETGNVLELNHAAASMLKVPIHSSKYTSIFPYLSEESKVTFTKFIKKVFESNKSEFEEFVFVNSDSESVYGNVNAETCFDSEQNDKVIRCTVVDVTQTKQYQREIQLQKELTDSEKRMRDIFDGSAVAMLIIDPENGAIEDANEAAADFYGYAVSQLKMMNISQINLLSEEKIAKEIENTKSSRRAFYRFKHKLSNDAVRDVEVYSTAIQIDDKTKLFSVIHDISERKAAEEKVEKINNQLNGAIQQANAANEELKSINEELNKVNTQVKRERKQFLSILNSIPETIYVADYDTHEILFANDKLKELVGRDITGEKCFEAIQNTTGVCSFCTIKQVMKSDKPYFWEHYNKNLGRYFYIMDRKIAWTDSREARFELAIDITKRKLAEQELRQEEWLLNQMGDIAEIGGWKIDLESQQLTWTKEVFAIHELEEGSQPSVEEAIAFYDEESLPVIEAALNEAIENGEPFDVELFIITAKGNKKFVRAKGRLHIEDVKKFIIGVFQDITMMKQKERELQDVNRRYKQLFEFMPVGISLADNEGKLLENNKEAERILGITQQEHNERTIDASEWKIIRKDGSIMPPEEFASVRAIKEKRLVENMEMGIWKGENNTTWINVSAIPSVSNDGLIISYIDISEKIERENKLREANATKDKFFNIIAHDLKNPFTSILGFTSLLNNNIEKYDRQKIKSYIERTENSSSRTYKLLENLLEWARMQTGKISFFPDRIILKYFIDNVIEQVESMAVAKKINIKSELTETESIIADENMLNATLRNLLTNALKFSHEESDILVKVNEQNGFTVFSVIDHGVGMDEDTIKKLFKVEEKISMPGTNNEAGTGLGLLLCKEFVEQHNGKISIESKLGEGSNFTFTIPKK